MGEGRRRGLGGVGDEGEVVGRGRGKEVTMKVEKDSGSKMG